MTGEPTVRDVTCTLHQRRPGQPCQHIPEGDCLTRWVHAYRCTVITQDQLATAYAGAGVFTAATIIPTHQPATTGGTA